MLLIDELLEQRADSIVTAVTITADSVLCEARGVPTWVGLEYMAQTACAHAGVIEARQGQLAGISLLLGSRAYQARVPFFAIGTRLIIEAQRLMSDDEGLVVFQCVIRDAANNNELAAGDIKAMCPHDLPALIKEQLHG